MPVDADTLEVPDEENNENAEAAAAFVRPPVGAIVPIRDPADEPYVFRFEVGPAILAQLLEKLRTLEPRPISDCLDARFPGFYQLFLDKQPVYIGKTSRPIGQRLKEHVKTLRGRIALHRVSCRFAYVEDPSLIDVAEGALINFFVHSGKPTGTEVGLGRR